VKGSSAAARARLERFVPASRGKLFGRILRLKFLRKRHGISRLQSALPPVYLLSSRETEPTAMRAGDMDTSTTLTLIDAAWAAAQSAAARGRKADALAQTERLLARPDLFPAVTRSARRFAGELALDLGRYATARRELRAAAQLDAECARTRFLLGRAWEEDPDGCDRRAAICFRSALARDAQSALYRAAFGRAAVRCGVVKRGARELVHAAELALDDAEVVRIAVSGLLEAGYPARARALLLKAQFARPRSPELGALLARTEFESARRAQKKARSGSARETTRYAQDARFATDGGRVTLPFLRVFDGTPRRDTGSVPRPHLARLPRNKADW
jgi:tetratricopeptide (TPR) repeat protein